MSGIATLDDWISSFKQEVPFWKTVAVTLPTNYWFDLITAAGQPSASALYNPANTTTGVVPTQATGNGFPGINAFATSGIGYLDKAEFSAQVSCCMKLVDVLWIGGAYAYNASTTGQTPASYTSRLPVDNSSNPDYKNLELYKGDQGIQGVTGVVATSATSGTTFEVLVLRRLWFGSVMYPQASDAKTLWETGRPQVFQGSALKLMTQWDYNGTSQPFEARFLIASK